MTQQSALDIAYFSSRTRSAVIWTSILSEPLLSAFSFISVILYKQCHASPFHISILTMLKPMVALLSLYWSISIMDRSDRLRSNVVWAGLLGRLPFFLLPFVRSPWAVIGVAAFYMMLKRGEQPAWLEIIKLNMPKRYRERVFSFSSAFAYAEGILIAIGIGMMLDRNPASWRWIFPLGATLGIFSVLIQSKLPINSMPLNIKMPVRSRDSWKKWLTGPWKHAFRLIKARPDFGFFQWGFMVCGSALMLIMPALPIFFVDTLGITFTDFAIAVGLFKGAGFALSSPIWVRELNLRGIFPIATSIGVLFGLFPIFIIMSQYGMAWFYLAYFVYGLAQGGSHLSWHMSGPIFSRNEDSSLYSGVNILMVGIRGCIGPVIGAVLCVIIGPLAVFSISAIMSFYAAYRLWKYSSTKLIFDN